MPEGPEVRRAANRIARALGNAPLEDVEFTQDHPIIRDLDEYGRLVRGAFTKEVTVE